MFVANVLTVWVEALQQVFGDDHPNERLRGIPVSTEYPQRKIDYPGIWVNYSMQGVVRNMGIGHVEYIVGPTGIFEIYRWGFGGVVEMTIGALGNLERALLVDEITKTIAVGRPGSNNEGRLRQHIDNSDLIGQNVIWESISITGFGETQGTPWGTDDVIYEASVSLTTTGEVLVDPKTDALVPLSAVRILDPEEGDHASPRPGAGWV